MSQHNFPQTRRNTRFRSIERSYARRQRGFSLLELMLALMLGVVVTAGIVQLFAGNNQTYAVLNGQSRMQESARYALDFITRSARTAGYVGCDPGDNIQSGLNGDFTNLFELDIANPIEVFNYTGGGDPGDTAIGDWAPSAAVLPRKTGASTSVNAFQGTGGIDLAVTAGALESGDIVAGSDILVLRRLEAPGVPIADIIQPGDPIEVEDGSQFAVNDFVVIANCNQATLVRVTGVAGNVLAWASTGTGLWENYGSAGTSTRSTLSAIGQPYGSATDDQGSAVYQVITDIYYIGYGAGTNNRNERNRSLWRKSGTGIPVELIEGVTDLQVRVGVDRSDTDGIDAPEQYVDFGAVNLGDVIRALRVEITASSSDIVDLENEEALERTFTQTISLRNPSPVT